MQRKIKQILHLVVHLFLVTQKRSSCFVSLRTIGTNFDTISVPCPFDAILWEDIMVGIHKFKIWRQKLREHKELLHCAYIS